MIQLYENISFTTSRIITRRYSTSFSLGTMLFDPSVRRAIYSLYGFVRLADEIVDTFHAHDQQALLDEFRTETWHAIERGISLNPVLQSFQDCVNTYNIDHEHIRAFFRSMEMDLDKTRYSREGYEEYIYGSAEVVGLMCLQIFCNNDQNLYEQLREPARRLGAAFQKVNFLRDLKDDYQELGRTYFPKLDMSHFNGHTKAEIEREIEADFKAAFHGIKQLPANCKLGVYVAYVYYLQLFKKIRSSQPETLLEERVRIPNRLKFYLMLQSYFRHKLNLL